jgi:hypothetical protein
VTGRCQKEVAAAAVAPGCTWRWWASVGQTVLQSEVSVMLEPKTTIEWGGALLWLLGIAAAAFLVSWVLTELLHLRRTLYVGALAVVTAGLTAGYVAWSGAGAAFWVTRWPWGLLGAVLAGALLARLVSRLPAAQPTRDIGGAASIWEGVVYGAAEGLLLSVLPVVVTWQLFAALDWTDGWLAVAAGAIALAASVAVIVVHHLGYREYRGPAMRSPVLGCTILSVAYLLTANPLAAIGGHIILHLAMLRRRMELPPHARSGPVDIAGEETVGARHLPGAARIG